MRRTLIAHVSLVNKSGTIDVLDSVTQGDQLGGQVGGQVDGQVPSLVPAGPMPSPAP